MRGEAGLPTNPGEGAFPKVGPWEMRRHPARFQQHGKLATLSAQPGRGKNVRRVDIAVISNELNMSAELVAEHGLKPDEYQRLLDLIGREPTLTELGIFSAMWNEHCSYKSSKVHLRSLPTKGPHVMQGPGENAGVIDIGDGLACVFKMESHNHPSYIEPYQGAATGVGGILRDVFTMGARPVACLDALSFGDPGHPMTRPLVSGVDASIRVTPMGWAPAEANKIFYSAASGVGMPIVYLGSKTGRDGIHGATMASAAVGADAAGKRPP